MRIVYWTKMQLAKAQLIEKLGAVPGTELVVAATLPEALAAMPGAAGIVLYDAPPEEAKQVIDVLKSPGNTVRWMHFCSAGREGFDAVGIPAGIAVTYAAGGASPAVAEHAMALLLSVGRRIPESLVQQSERKWDRAPAARSSSLEGRTMAIIGYGNIGQEIAKRARGFGTKLIAVSRSAKADELVDEAAPLSSLHEVLGRADVVVVAIALTNETHHLLDAAALAACKRGALIVNIARGGVIDQAALCEALRSGQIGGAGLDVTDPEPLPVEDPLWSCPNLIITSHYAGAGSPATLRRLADSAGDNLLRLTRGEPLLNQVSG